MITGADAQILASVRAEGGGYPKGSPGQPSYILLKDYLKELEAKHKVSIAYKTALLENVRVDTLLTNSARQETGIESKLDLILKNLNIQYRKPREGFYVLYEDGSKNETSSKPDGREPLIREVVEKAMSDQRETIFTMSGSVIDAANNQGIPGVNILLKGSNTGTATRADRSNKLDLPAAEGILVFSYISYVTQEIVVGSQSVIDVKLSENVNALSEVVVTLPFFDLSF
jgi:hypothetical protein